MANIATLDLDEGALVKRPRPIGWYVAGLLGLGVLGVVGALYLPLRAAHLKLAAAHAELAQKAGELDRSLRGTREELEQVRTDRDRLSGSAKETELRAQEERSRLERIAATLSASQAPAVRAGWLSVTSDAHGARARFAPGKVFVGAAAQVAPALIKPLCAAGESVALPGELALRASVHVGAAADAKAWGLAGERAAALAQVLTERCKLEPGRVGVGLQATPADESVELWIGAPRP